MFQLSHKNLSHDFTDVFTGPETIPVKLGPATTPARLNVTLLLLPDPRTQVPGTTCAQLPSLGHWDRQVPWSYRFKPDGCPVAGWQEHPVREQIQTLRFWSTLGVYWALSEVKSPWSDFSIL